MWLTVFGATGGTGRHLVSRGLQAGHRVTAVVRDPARLDARHDRLEIVRADVLEPGAIEAAVAGRDAVVSALGPRGGRGPTTVCSAGTASVLTAMQATGVRRFVGISAAPVAVDDEGDRLLYRLTARPLLRALFTHVYADLALMEAQLRRSDVDWIVLRAPRLTDKPAAGHYRTALNGNVPGGYVISRADLADAILDRLDDPAAIRATVGIGY
ncbi:MAG: NAD(P)H-binding protein [Pseudonocardiaceae bacterium]|nr:NAD(P)H-binding protein [Pseudonocardiaceae bacterium]